MCRSRQGQPACLPASGASESAFVVPKSLAASLSQHGLFLWYKRKTLCFFFFFFARDDLLWDNCHFFLLPS